MSEQSSRRKWTFFYVLPDRSSRARDRAPHQKGPHQIPAAGAAIPRDHIQPLGPPAAARTRALRADLLIPSAAPAQSGTSRPPHSEQGRARARRRDHVPAVQVMPAADRGSQSADASRDAQRRVLRADAAARKHLCEAAGQWRRVRPHVPSALRAHAQAVGRRRLLARRLDLAAQAPRGARAHRGVPAPGVLGTAVHRVRRGARVVAAGAAPRFHQRDAACFRSDGAAALRRRRLWRQAHGGGLGAPARGAAASDYRWHLGGLDCRRVRVQPKGRRAA